MAKEPIRGTQSVRRTVTEAGTPGHRARGWYAEETGNRQLLNKVEASSTFVIIDYRAYHNFCGQDHARVDKGNHMHRQGSRQNCLSPTTLEGPNPAHSL